MAGTITDIAFFYNGNLSDRPLKIPEITLASHSWHALVASVWSDWKSFRGWSGLSINYLYGTYIQTGVRDSFTHGCYGNLGGAGVDFFVSIDRSRPRENLISYSAAILIPWITLDQIWQGELSSQLQETKQLFSGKTTHEKHLVDVDQDIYRYTRRLKEDVLPSSPARIFILHDSWVHNLERLKTQYYLLPHNIYNFNQWQPSQHLRSGDYILALGAVPGLTVNARDNQLSWQGTSFGVTVIDLDKRGTLYRIPLSADLPVSPDNRQAEPNG